MVRTRIAWVVMMLLTMCLCVNAEFILLDNFDNGPGGAIDGRIPNGALGGMWDTQTENSTQGGNVSFRDGSNTLRVFSVSSGDGRGAAVNGLTDTIDEGEIGVVFFRFLISSERSNPVGSVVGLHTQTGNNPISNANNLALIIAGFRAEKNTTVATDPYDIYTIDGSQVLKTDLARDAWYNAWIVADNGTDTYDLYISAADGPAGEYTMPAAGDLVVEKLPFNTPTTDPLTGMMFFGKQFNGSGQVPLAYFDEFWWQGHGGLTSAAANTPVPANNATLVSRTPTLSWEAPDADIADPNFVSITGYDVYMDPNEADVAAGKASTLVSANQPDTHFDVTAALEFDTTYFWRVDTHKLMNDGAVIVDGAVWNFTTLSEVPFVLENPADLFLEAGQAAEMSVSFKSVSAIHYQWYQSMDDATDTPGDDAAVGTDSALLSIAEVTRDDEGYYYCVGTNGGGSTPSATARLGVARMVAHWTLDQSDFVGGQYLDSSGEGHHADPNSNPVIVAGKVNEGVQMLSNEAGPLNGWADAGTWNPSEFSDQLTVSFWLNWAGVNGTYQTFIGKREGGYTPETMVWQIATGNNDSTIRLQSQIGNVAIVNGLEGTEGTWQHFVASFDGTTTRLYINGEQKNSGTGFVLGTGVDVPLLIGRHGDGEYMNGVLDDVKIFNYGLDEYEVATLYYNDSEIPICLAATKPEYDYNDDCVVNLLDFQIFALTWMDCGYVPTCVQTP